MQSIKITIRREITSYCEIFSGSSYWLRLSFYFNITVIIRREIYSWYRYLTVVGECEENMWRRFDGIRLVSRTGLYMPKQIRILHHEGKIRYLEARTLVHQCFIKNESYNEKGNKNYQYVTSILTIIRIENNSWTREFLNRQNLDVWLEIKEGVNQFHSRNYGYYSCDLNHSTILISKSL